MSVLELVLIVTTLGSVGGMFYLSLRNKKDSLLPSTLPEKAETIEKSEGKKIEEVKSILQEPRSEQVSKEQVVIDAHNKAREIVLEARDDALKIKRQSEEESRKIRQEAMELEKRIDVRQETLDKKISDIDRHEHEIIAKEGKAQNRLNDLETVYKQQVEKLEAVSGMTREEAKKSLILSVERELSQEVSKRVREAEEKIKQESEIKAKEIIVDSMLHASTDYVVEYTVSKVKLPDEEIKGRIIGKEGRNIKVFEEQTGVNLEMEEGSADVRISSFDPIRREIARVSLDRLIADGRIQPAKIEEIVQRTAKEIDHIIFKAGEELCHKVGVYNLPKDLIFMLGKFKYRFSYGQNMIQHTLEETKLGIQLASELKLDVNIVRLGCLFHDIGKIVTDEEGTHVQLGVDLLKKFKVLDSVINCVAEHHEDKPFSSLESVVVHIADSISGARPGARSEDYEAYVKRMRDLEAAATSFDGIEKAYAISAGREVRIFVKPERVDDSSSALLAREIAKKIELEQTYPGTVKVTVIRETRYSDTAK
ncbi:MAG: ribonuclease Y [Patescibacteria group bacterium]